ncbi:DNA mismatch repair protein MutL [Terriglobus roseus DSM 18391]|uniref:DNA mismatch repair protein MutL n=1 Tax=Terriglobus roseus (strain DSM 18391 / NRRL B-41598 / KBS 63) TaxID=926566 RepID=I3ZCS2_TERRK|nr:DNA mismatch repair endonuclease MutL [Terriglobus roseus]AFL87040.1 DNA mismatch repair protein MutL [Terriglobus roseus DSM 18391]
MGRIRVLSDQVANQIAAGEVVERPASVVKELLENAVDAGATRIRIEVEGGGRKLIRIVDNGHGMVRDDAMLAFERHATSKLRSADDLLHIATLGFRGEALPSIASVARVELDTRSEEDAVGTRIEIHGGKMTKVEDVGVPVGTTIAIRDLFFNVPARKKFLKSEPTELSHVAALVTHYALAHPEKHFELHSATHALLVAPAVRDASERLYQILGSDISRDMLPCAAEVDFTRAGLPEPPPWRREEDYVAPEPGYLRVRGFVSKPELQKLNRGSIYVFVNGRQVRDRLILHALTEAYKNILPPTSFPVVLLFLEMPAAEVDVNVHPAKTEVRFRQSSFVHDFVRDTVRNTVLKARPAASFLSAIAPSPRIGLLDGQDSIELDPVLRGPGPGSDAPWSEHQIREASEEDDRQKIERSFGPIEPTEVDSFSLTVKALPAVPGRLTFGELPNTQYLRDSPAPPAQAWNTHLRNADLPDAHGETHLPIGTATRAPAAERIEDTANLAGLSGLRPLGQVQNSFILAVNEEGLWIIDQHVAHERILFEKVLRERQVERVQRQRLLMPLLIDLVPAQMANFAGMADELNRNGFEAEPFGPRTLAVKSAPVGLEGKELELTLAELLQTDDDAAQADNMETRARRIAASIACHAAVKINMPLETSKMQWLLDELGKTENPMACPHGRPIALRYSHKEIQRAFQRI